MHDLKLHPECMSDLAFDRVLGDSAEPGERARVRGHVEGCARCALRWQALAQQRTAFLQRIPSWRHLQRQQQAERPSQRSRGWLQGGSAALAASLLLTFWMARSVDTPGFRSKGGPRIGAYVKHGEQVTRVDTGSTVFPGDYVRFTYSSDRPMHFALLNRDALHATTYYPLGLETAPLKAGLDVALDFSIKLDRQPGSERIHGLFCEQPQRLEPLRAALQATGRLSPPPHCHVDVLTLEKKLE
jgi:hypothetical protein